MVHDGFDSLHLPNRDAIMRMLFDFICESCGATFEDLIDDSAGIAECPECSGRGKRRPGGAGQMRFRPGKTLVKGESVKKPVLPGMKPFVK